MKALLGISVVEATLVTVGVSARQAELAAAAADPNLLASLLHSKRNTLLILLGISVANVVLAVWRPKLTVKIRRPRDSARSSRWQERVGSVLDGRVLAGQRYRTCLLCNAMTAAPNISTAPTPSAQPKRSPSATTPTPTAITGLTKA